LEEIKKTLKRCAKLNLKIIVCASSLREVKEIKKLRPYAIAFEDPRFIGTKKSITKYGSKDILDFVEVLEGTQIVPICGSGINSADDYLEALGLGCSGVLISSAIVNAGNPAKLLEKIGEW
jgi:triosephosphate isomerase